MDCVSMGTGLFSTFTAVTCGAEGVRTVGVSGVGTGVAGTTSNCDGVGVKSGGLSSTAITDLGKWAF